MDRNVSFDVVCVCVSVGLGGGGEGVRGRSFREGSAVGLSRGGTGLLHGCIEGLT